MNKNKPYITRTTGTTCHTAYRAHLAPRPGVRYPCRLTFEQTGLGELICTRQDFGALSESPWMQIDINNFVAEKATQAGAVYRFAGTYTKFKNGSCRFRGEITRVGLEP